MPVSNVPLSELSEASLSRDQWRDIKWSPDNRNFVLEWTELMRRREYEFHIFTNTLDIEARRRDVKKALPTRRSTDNNP